MNRGEIRTRVLRWVHNRPDVTPDLINPLIDDVYRGFAIPFRFHETEGTHTLATVSGTASYPLTSDDIYSVLFVRDMENGTVLTPFHGISEYEMVQDQTIDGPPEKYIRWGLDIIFFPVPDFTLDPGIRIRGVKLPAPLLDDAAEPVFPEDWHPIIEYQTASIVAFQKGLDERGMMLQNLALSKLSSRQEAHTIEAFTRHMSVIVERTRGRTSL